jgi:hypothetical protein
MRNFRIRIQEVKNDPKMIKQLSNFMFLSAGCSFWGTGRFSCRMTAFHGSLRIKILHFVNPKHKHFFQLL